MKKNFLILMLMALLPLAGWADTFDVSKFHTKNFSYGTAAFSNDFLTVDDGYATVNNEPQYVADLTTFYGSNENTVDGVVDATKVYSAENLATTDAGKYWIKITGVENGQFDGQEVYKDFWINPAKVYVEFPRQIENEPNASLTKVFGTTQDPQFVYNVTDGNNAISAELLAALDLTVTRAEGEDAGHYAFSAKTENANFNAVVSTWEVGNEQVVPYFTITPKEVTLTIELGNEKLIYNGNNQVPTITVKDADNNVLPYKDGDDEINFTFTYQYAANSATAEQAPANGYNDAANHANAGWYKVSVAIRQAGQNEVYGSNYVLAQAQQQENLTSAPFQIAQATVNVYVNSTSKEYNGTDNIPATATIAYSGLQGADANKQNPFDVVENDQTTRAFNVVYAEAGDHQNVGDHKLVPEPNPQVEISSNYSINILQTGKLTVNKKKITVKPNNAEKEFEAAEPNYTVDASQAIKIEEGEAPNVQVILNDQETIANAYKVTRAEDETLGDKDLTLVAKTTEELTEGLNEQAAAALVTKTTTALGNYEITLGTGKLTIGAGTLYVYPKSVAVTYGTPTPTFEVVATTAAGTEVTLTTKPTVKFKDAKYETAAPTNAGTYVLTLDGPAAATGYTVFQPLDGQYTISPIALTPVIETQTLQGGEGLDQTKVSFDGIIEGDEDKIAYVLGFNVQENAEEGLIPANQINEGKLIAQPANQTYADGIMIKERALAQNEVSANDNYIIDWTKTGKLIVGTGGAQRMILDPAAQNAADQPAAVIENNAGETLDVTFVEGAVTMNEKEWYAMVLPFETTPAEIVSALGTYVVVNKIKSSTMEAGVVDVKFGLEWDKIEAGVPFLIKPAAEVDWARTEENNNEQVPAPTFFDKQIFSAIKNAVTDKATFAGTYAKDESVKWGLGLDGTTADDAAKYRWLAHKEYKGDNNWKNPKTNKHDLAPMEAYLILDPAAEKARIYVEDIDENGTTAIKSLSVDDVKGLNVKGMYTIGGMKLQGAPTQKGVYIKDGKKVIVK